MIIALTALIAPRSRTRRSDAYDRVVDVLGEFVAHGRAHLVIALAVMTIGGGGSPIVWFPNGSLGRSSAEIGTAKPTTTAKTVMNTADHHDVPAPGRLPQRLLCVEEAATIATRAGKCGAQEM